VSTPPLPTLIYHITHIDNLPAILSSGELRAKTRLDTSGGPNTSIAYTSVQDRRAQTPVPCGRGGTLHDYVPFYFAPRSPMLYTIHRGNVSTCPRQGPVVYLVSTAQVVRDARLPYAFTDGHGIMALTSYFDDLVYLDAVDWAIMRDRYWSDTLTDNDRRRRRQAEFLVQNFMPWGLITQIGVISPTMKNNVEDMLRRFGPTHKPAVAIHYDWYY